MTTDWLSAVTFADKNNGTIVGANGTILHTANGGTTWIREQSGTTQTLCAVSFVNANIGIAVGLGVILHTTNGGATWTSQTNGVSATGSYLGVAFSDALNGTVVGFGGTVLRTIDGGASWSKQTNGIDPYKNLFGVSFSRQSTGIVVGDGGMVFTTTDGGSHWTTQVVGTTACLFGVSFSLPSRSFVMLKIFDVMGREVATLIEEELSAGAYAKQWNASGMPSGVYFYRLQAGTSSETKRLILQK
ncbi:MAG TPA: YCF48-related protein [Bacteroidota bacterium]|nr:YCF48-related protein [Bacteroidota bacterium]